MKLTNSNLKKKFITTPRSVPWDLESLPKSFKKFKNKL